MVLVKIYVVFSIISIYLGHFRLCLSAYFQVVSEQIQIIFGSRVGLFRSPNLGRSKGSKSSQPMVSFGFQFLA